MANKSRPKKTRGVFYKKYVYGAAAQPIEGEDDDFGDNWEDDEDWSIQNIDNKKKLVKSKNRCVSASSRPRQVAAANEDDVDDCEPDDFVPKNLKLLLKKKFQNMIKCLDLSRVVQSGKNSYMSKLLRRTSNSLEVFISSQSSFGAAPLVSIKSCLRLKVLDLRLVSESVNLAELFKSIQCLPELEQLCFPRSSVTCDEFDFQWPQKLWYLRLQGGITDFFAANVRFPETITCLEFAHCSHLTRTGLDDILSHIGINLTRLSITYPMPKIGDDGADRSFWFCPNLKSFFVDIAYISWELFSEELLVVLKEYDRPLRSMTIESTGYMGMCEKLSPNDITIAVDEERLPCFERLGLSAMLGWDFKSDDMNDMISELDHHNIEVFKI
ncbi:hypothetical protein PMKS-001900 [Pichia membranifaciens]|uniref:Uncharacterized protein n=1 Tax=Pichia membranifaciens TaxID=4926 RepID=A0A1Q2YFW3_9ASCO|nr:hypothetical protein PMKS-001900 [Pichia membranifaciens]